MYHFVQLNTDSGLAKTLCSASFEVHMHVKNPFNLSMEFCPLYTVIQIDWAKCPWTAYSEGLTQACVIFSHACPVLQLPIQLGWYFGNIKRAEAEKLLFQTGNPTGTFLIGELDSQPGDYFLAVRDIDRVVCYRIKKADTSEYCMLLWFMLHIELCSSLAILIMYRNLKTVGFNKTEWFYIRY